MDSEQCYYKILLDFLIESSFLLTDAFETRHYDAGISENC